mgnify:FL=1
MRGQVGAASRVGIRKDRDALVDVIRCYGIEAVTVGNVPVLLVIICEELKGKGFDRERGIWDNKTARRDSMTFEQIEEFCVVARLENFTKAAEYLYVSQSTLSRHISDLESNLYAP